MKHLKTFESNEWSRIFDIRVIDKKHHWEYLTLKEYFAKYLLHDKLTDRDIEKLDEIFGPSKSNYDYYPFDIKKSDFGKGSIRIFGVISKLDSEPNMSMWEYDMRMSIEYKIGSDSGKIMEANIIFSHTEDIKNFIEDIDQWIEIDYSE